MDSITITEITLRLVAAMAVGVIVGGQRTRTAHPAGLRTHMLVAIGSAVVMIVGNCISTATAQIYGSVPDPARLGAQVISGIGFLGAGTILKEGLSVKGLTTAASLWAVACLGLAVGCGYYVLALLGSVAVFMTLSVFERIQKRVYTAVFQREKTDTEHRNQPADSYVGSALSKPSLSDAEEDNSSKDRDEEQPTVCIQFRWKCNASETDVYLSSLLQKLMNQPEVDSVCLIKDANEKWNDTLKMYSHNEQGGKG